jgi:hypothetical protein
MKYFGYAIVGAVAALPGAAIAFRSGGSTPGRRNHTKKGLMKKNLISMPILLAVVALAGCGSNRQTWYEQRCENLGFQAGTADFDNCIARDRA